MTGENSALSPGRLVRNAVINAAATLLLFLTLFVAYPALINAFGESRMGVFLLVIAMVGYFSIFDLGINRALTRLLARQFAAGERAEASVTLQQGLYLLGLLGLIAAMSIFLLAPSLAGDSGEAMHSEAVDSLRIASLSLVFILLNAGFRSVLEANQAFGVINAITVPASILTYLGPLAIALSGGSLAMAVFFIVIIRILVCLAFFLVSMPRVAGRWQFALPNMPVMLSLIRFGGWLTVSRLINPVFLYFDRFLIGALLGLSAVTWYATPFELTWRMLILAQTLINVLFPAFSALAATDEQRLRRMAATSLKAGVVLMAMAAALVILFAHPFLAAWISPEFARQSAHIWQLLIVGALINFAAHFPAALLQALDRPDISAKLQMAELPVYVVFLLVMISAFGITGAAIAWTVRNAVDAGLHFYFGERVFRTGGIRENRRRLLLTAQTAALLAICLIISLLNTTVLIAVSCVAVLIILFLYASWRWAFSETEQQAMRELIGRRMPWVGGRQ